MDDERLPLPKLVHRLLGPPALREQVGVGVMDKSGRVHDQTASDPWTFSLIYVLRGRGRYRYDNGHWHELNPGDCFVRIPGHRHSNEIDPDSRWLEVYIDLGHTLPLDLLELRVLQPNPPAWRWGLDGRRVARFMTLMAELEAAGERELPALCVRCQALVVEAMAAQGDPTGGSDDPIERLCRLLAEEAGRRTDLRQFCARERLDFERFRKDFTRRIGLSPGQYRIRRRMERACALLTTTEDGLAAIAAELGYASTYEFSAQFRQWFGTPPGRWRANHGWIPGRAGP